MIKSVSIFLTICIMPAAAQLASFPGAKGFGAAATGGRAKTVYHVTNLNDSGAGSFRDAVSSSNRTVVFDVGGYIKLSSAVSAKSNLTIAGQTAPGGGIGIMGYEVSFANSSNIICRFVRIRPGGDSPSTDDCLSFYRAQNIIVDHTSLEYAKWNNIDAVGDSTHLSSNITVQDSIIANPIGQQFGAHTECVGGNFSWFNNVFSSGHNRQPLAKDNTIFINNTLYNFSAGYTTHTSTPFKHDIINNYFICGPASGSGGNTWYQIDTNQSMYYSGNLLDSDKNSVLGGGSTAPYPGYQGTGTVLASPWSPITTALLPSVLSPANAVVYNNCNAGTVPRDETDTLIISQVKTLGNGATGYGPGSAGPGGGLYTSQAQTGLSNNGFGTIAGGTVPIDSDQDGMPDDWETAKSLNASNAVDGATTAASGYTNLEDYLNWLALPHAFVGKNTAVAPSAVDIDLSRYAAGFPTGAVFTLSGITNGTATQSGAGGYLVHFVPTLNVSGIGGFSFSVTNGSYTMSRTAGVLVSTAAAAKNLLWKGDGASNYWNSTTFNWTNQGTGLPDVYAAGDRVMFNDTGSHSPAVNITSVISPASIEVNADQSNYTFSGYGWLSGATALVKNGPGALTIAPTIPTTSGTLVSGSSSVSVASTANLTVGMPVSGSGIPSSTNLTAINSGTSTITLSKTATLSTTSTLSFIPANTFTGPTTFNAGTILLSAGGTLGAGTLNLASTMTNNAGANDTISLGNAVVVAAGNSGTVNMGNRFVLGGSVTGGGELNLNVQSIVTRNDINSTFSGFTGDLNFTGSGGVRLFASSSFDNFGSSSVNLGSGVTLAPQTSSGGNTIAIGELTGNGTLDGGSAGAVAWSIGGLHTSVTFSGNIQGNASLTKTGTGKLTLAGLHTQTGATTVSSGTLAMYGPLGGSLVLSGGTLSIATADTPTGNLAIANSLTLTSGTLVYDLSNSPAGANDKITVNAGTLTQKNTTNVQIRFTDGVLGSGVYYLVDGAATMAASGNTTPVLISPQPTNTRQILTIERSSNASANGYLRLAVAGDAANLVWTGANGGVWDLSTTGGNFSGNADDKFYNLDTVTFSDTSGVGAVTLSGSLQPNVLNVSNGSTAYTLSGSGVLGGAARVVKNGNGIFTIANTVANTFTGGITLNAGTLALGNSNSNLGNGVISINGGTLGLVGLTSGYSLPNSIVVNAPASVTSSGNVTIVGATTNTLSGPAGANLDLSGFSGILTIGGDMGNYAGTISLGASGSTLRLNGNTNANYGSTNALFDLGVGAGKLCNRNGDMVIDIGALQGGPNTTLQGRQTGSGTTVTTYVIGARNLDTVFAGSIATGGDLGGLTINKIGTGNLTLNGTSSFIGAVEVTSGTLTVGGSITSDGDATVDPGANLVLAGGTFAAQSVTNAGVISGYGTIGGDLASDVAFVGRGFSSGIPGLLTVDGSASFGSSSSIKMRGGSTSDLIAITGDLALAGTVQIALAPGTAFGRYPIFTCAGSIEFQAVTLTGIPVGITAQLSTSVAGMVALVIDDSDEDGLPDSWEMQYFGNLASGPTSDNDGDGQSNAMELLTGTNPASGASVFAATVTPVDNSHLFLTWPSVPGKSYRVETNPTLAGSWSTLATIPGAPSPAVTTNLTVTKSGSVMFYRVALSP